MLIFHSALSVGSYAQFHMISKDFAKKAGEKTIKVCFAVFVISREEWFCLK